MKKIFKLGIVLGSFLPAATYALTISGSTISSSSCTPYTLKCLADKIVGYLGVAIYLIITLAVVTFIWNVYKYFFRADAENKKEAGMYVLYSTIGFFVILSFWGLVKILSNTLNVPDYQPDIPFSNGIGASQSNSHTNMGSSGL